MTASYGQIVTATLGNGDLVTNGAFGADTDWTKEAGWAIAAGVASFTAFADLITNGAMAADTDWTKGTGWAIATGVATHTAPSDLVTNGTFGADTDWTKGTGWTISDGKANAAGSVAYAPRDLQQGSLSLTAGRTYRVTGTISGRTTGTLTPKLEGTTEVRGTAIEPNGAFSQDLVAVTGNNTLSFEASGVFNGSLDGVTLTDVTDSALEQGSLTLVAGETYEVTFTIANRTAGSITPRFTGGTTVAGTAEDADGAVTQELVAVTGNNALSLLASYDFDGDIDDVTLTRISDGAISQAVTLVPGVLYRLGYTVSSTSAGGVTPKFTGGTAVSGTQATADGAVVEYIRAKTGNTTLVFDASADFDGAIDAVSLWAYGTNFLEPVVCPEGKYFNVSINGTFTGTLDLQRSFDGGTTWYTDDTFTQSAQTEKLTVERGIMWRLQWSAYTSGTAVVRLSQ